MATFPRLLVFLVLVLCSVPSRAQEADEVENTTDQDDLVILPREPFRIQPPLAPPSDHWVYKLPNQEQVKTAAVELTVLNHLGQPVPGASVIALCEPWQFLIGRRTRSLTDDTGRVMLRGPVGDWSFLVNSASRGAGLVGTLRRVPVRQDAKLELRTEKEIEFRVVLPGRSPPSRGRSSADLEFRVTGWTLSPPAVRIGSLVNSAVRLSVTRDCAGLVSLGVPSDGQGRGYLISFPFRTSEPGPIVVDDRQLGRLVLAFDGYPKGNARVRVGLEPRSGECGSSSAVLRVPPSGGRHAFLVTPGEYAIAVAVTVRGSGAVQYVPRRVVVEAGQEKTLVHGGKFEARINVRKWFSRFLDAWFDILDDKGTYLLRTKGTAHVKLDYAGKTIFDEDIHKCQGRWFRLDHDFGPVRERTTATFTYTMSSNVMGNVVLAGTVPEGRDENLRADLPMVYQSEHFSFRFRENWPEVAKRGADNMEAALGWLTDHFAGPIQTRGGGRLMEIRAWTPVGVGASGGDAVRICIYSAYDFDGVGRVLFHELGHAYTGHPPHHQAGLGGTFSESMATLIGDYCIRAAVGEGGFNTARAKSNGRFFAWRLGDGDPEGPSGPNRMEFTHHYIHDRYGQQTQRRCFLAMCASRGNLAELVKAADFLTDDVERIAAVYSCLTGENLGWLYRWAGFVVSDSKIDQALRLFKDRQVRLP